MRLDWRWNSEDLLAGSKGGQAVLILLDCKLNREEMRTCCHGDLILLMSLYCRYNQEERIALCHRGLVLLGLSHKPFECVLLPLSYFQFRKDLLPTLLGFV